MGDDESKYEDAMKRERYEEHIEVSIVPQADTVTDPRTVMVKSLCANNP